MRSNFKPSKIGFLLRKLMLKIWTILLFNSIVILKKLPILLTTVYNTHSRFKLKSNIKKEMILCIRIHIFERFFLVDI